LRCCTVMARFQQVEREKKVAGRQAVGRERQRGVSVCAEHRSIERAEHACAASRTTWRHQWRRVGKGLSKHRRATGAALAGVRWERLEAATRSHKCFRSMWHVPTSEAGPSPRRKRRRAHTICRTRSVRYETSQRQSTPYRSAAKVPITRTLSRVLEA
jgi:hypothetical protein